MYCFALSVRRKQEDDDDIVAGTASMSLKDPVRSFFTFTPYQKC